MALEVIRVWVDREDHMVSLCMPGELPSTILAHAEVKEFPFDTEEACGRERALVAALAYARSEREQLVAAGRAALSSPQAVYDSGLARAVAGRA